MQAQTESALEIFEQPLTKSIIKLMAQDALESIKDTGNVLKVAEALSAMELFIKEVKGSEEFKEHTREEISKYPKGYTSPSGAKLECAETGSKYDYSACNDLEYVFLTNRLELASKEVKERETFLKAIPQSGLPQEKLDEETGELIKWTVYPPSKSSTSSYKITLAK